MGRRRASRRENRPPLTAAVGALLLLACVAAAIPPAPATQPATAPALSAAELALLHRLESGTWRERQSAEDDLTALPGMDDATVHAMLGDTKSPEAEARLDTILKDLAEQRDAGTSLITLHVKDAPAKAVYAELFRQAFATMDPEPADLLDEPSIPPLTIDVDRQPFWTVEQQLAASSHIGLSMLTDGTYELRGGAEIEPGPQAIAGPLLCVLSHGGSYYARRIRRGGANPFVDLMVFPEPKVRLLTFSPRLHIEQAVDNNGNHLKLSSTRQTISVRTRSEHVTWQIPFDPAAKNPGDHLTRLRATLTVQLALQLHHVAIDNVLHAGPRDFHIGAMTIKFEGCKKVNGWYQVTFSGAGPDAGLHLVQFLQQPTTMFRMLDDHGNPLSRGGMGFSTGPQGVSISYMFGVMRFGRNGVPTAAPEPSRLICDLPGEIKTIEVPIDFKNIDVPIAGNG